MVAVTLRRWRKEEGRTAHLVRLLEGHSPSERSRSRVLMITSAAFSHAEDHSPGHRNLTPPASTIIPSASSSLSSPSSRLSSWRLTDALRQRPSATHGEFASRSDCFVSCAISYPIRLQCSVLLVAAPVLRGCLSVRGSRSV